MKNPVALFLIKYRHLDLYLIKNGVVTAANASSINDGAAALTGYE